MATSKVSRSLRGIPPLITVSRASATPLHRQIYEGFRAKLLQRELRSGQLVPSTRELAAELHISRIPILNAYAQLLAEGYFESRVGAGTFVSTSLPDWPPVHADRRAAVPAGPREPRVVAARASILPRYERPAWLSGRGAFNISQPAMGEFPFRIWSELLTRYSRNLHVSALQYSFPLGLEELREAIATYLRTARGVRCEPQQIMIVSGSQQALDIATRVLLDPGARVWVEEPGYWLIHDVLKAAGCRAIPVPVDDQGLVVAEGIKLCGKARAAFVAPSHQFPLGVTMSASRRLQMLEWARKARAWVVEDDYDSEYRYDSMPIASLQGLDRDDRVIYIGTFSKVLFPSLRIGYVVIPPDLVERFIAVRHAMDICPSHALQAVLAAFIREGHFSRHIRRMRLLYRERRTVLADAIRSEFGSRLQLLGGEAGMHLTVLLPDRVRDHEVSERAARKNLWLWPLSPLYFGTRPRQGFVLGFGNATSKEIPEAVRTLKRLLRP